MLNFFYALLVLIVYCVSASYNILFKWPPRNNDTLISHRNLLVIPAQVRLLNLAREYCITYEWNFSYCMLDCCFCFLKIHSLALNLPAQSTVIHNRYFAQEDCAAAIGKIVESTVGFLAQLWRWWCMPKSWTYINSHACLKKKWSILQEINTCHWRIMMVEAVSLFVLSWWFNQKAHCCNRTLWPVL